MRGDATGGDATGRDGRGYDAYAHDMVDMMDMGVGMAMGTGPRHQATSSGPRGGEDGMVRDGMDAGRRTYRVHALRAAPPSPPTHAARASTRGALPRDA
jgi:hypothetical protein